MCTFSVVTLWHTLLTIFSCWSQRPTALSGSDLGRLPRYRRIAKSLNFSRKLKIPCCHNTRWLVLLCGGERERLSGGGGGGEGEGRRFSFTCGRSKPGKRFRIQWCQTSYTPNLYACSVRNVIVFHRREKTIQIHFMWTGIFLKTDKLISVLKNIWIRVDILKLNIAGTFPLSYWFKAFSRF